MTNPLRDLMTSHDHQQNGTNAGDIMHRRLMRVCIDGQNTTGDPTLLREIVSHPEIASFFIPAARTEVPVAAISHDRTLSRRIDRMIIDDATRTIRILDYKTDIDRTALRDKYVSQLREYVTIMRRIYPNYRVSGHILWTHDWTLETIECSV